MPRGQATIRINEKGGQAPYDRDPLRRAEAIGEYIAKAELTSGSLFRPRLNSRSQKLGSGLVNPVTMYLLIQGYLERLPGATKEVERADGTKQKECAYTPHSLRATATTLFLDAGVDIRKVQELIGHKHVTTTQIYDKRRRTTAENASHDMPI